MKKDPALGNAFMDIAFSSAVCGTIAMVVALIDGGGIDITLVGAGVLTYGAYLTAAIRVGV